MTDLLPSNPLFTQQILRSYCTPGTDPDPETLNDQDGQSPLWSGSLLCNKGRQTINEPGDKENKVGGARREEWRGAIPQGGQASLRM